MKTPHTTFENTYRVQFQKMLVVKYCQLLFLYVCFFMFCSPNFHRNLFADLKRTLHYIEVPDNIKNAV